VTPADGGAPVSIEGSGPVAHLVECRHGMAEVVGSIPIGSTHKEAGSSNAMTFYVRQAAIPAS
jgi:hypothetical protein